MACQPSGGAAPPPSLSPDHDIPLKPRPSLLKLLATPPTKVKYPSPRPSPPYQITLVNFTYGGM